MHNVLISLGSNIEPELNLPESVRLLAERCRLVAVSAVYETAPVGKTDQPNFLNAAVLVETELAPSDLKNGVLLVIEDELGRVRSGDKNAPRTIDLDIALFGEDTIEVDGRRIPDPDILKHPHVALPLADVAPFQRHPETGRTLSEIAEGLGGGGIKARPDVSLWPARDASPREEETGND